MRSFSSSAGCHDQLALGALAGNQQRPRITAGQGPRAGRAASPLPACPAHGTGSNARPKSAAPGRKVDRLGLDGHGPRRDDRQAHRRGQADRRQACASPLSQQAVHHATPSQPNSRDTAHPSTPANRIADPRPGAKRPPAGSVVARRLRMASGKPARSQRREKRWIDGRVEKRWGDAAVRAGLAVDDVKTAAVDNRSCARVTRRSPYEIGIVTARRTCGASARLLPGCRGRRREVEPGARASNGRRRPACSYG